MVRGGGDTGWDGSGGDGGWMMIGSGSKQTWATWESTRESTRESIKGVSVSAFTYIAVLSAWFSLKTVSDKTAEGHFNKAWHGISWIVHRDCMIIKTLKGCQTSLLALRQAGRPAGGCWVTFGRWLWPETQFL